MKLCVLVPLWDLDLDWTHKDRFANNTSTGEVPPLPTGRQGLLITEY